MQASVRIHGKSIGAGQPAFVIAEAGSNHNGSLDIAHRLVDVAARAGADAIKFQTFEAKHLYPRGAGRSDYLGVETPIFDLIEAMEMPPAWLGELAAHAHDAGLAFLSSPFHEEAVELLAPHVDAFKIASYELTHEPLLEHVAARGGAVLLSTGAADLDEARRAVDVLARCGCEELILLQCTAAYPAPLEAINVRAMTTLARELGVPAGLSDHSRDPTAAPMAAAALGAAVIEKHFTLSNALPGPDHAFAVEPDELRRLVEGVRRVEAALGSGIKAVHPVEHELRAFARRSVFTIRPVAGGEAFSRDNVAVLRNGKLGAGLAPAELGRVLAATAARDLAAETPLSETDLAPR